MPPDEIAQIALELLHRFREQPVAPLPLLPWDQVSTCTGHSPLPQHFALLWGRPVQERAHWSQAQRREAVELAIAPAMSLWARDLPHGCEFGYLEQPASLDSGIAHGYGYLIRAVIDDEVPVPGPPHPDEIWGEVKRYYHSGTDEMRVGKCGLLLRLDILPTPRRQTQGEIEDRSKGPRPLSEAPSPPKTSSLTSAVYSNLLRARQ